MQRLTLWVHREHYRRTSLGLATISQDQCCIEVNIHLTRLEARSDCIAPLNKEHRHYGLEAHVLGNETRHEERTTANIQSRSDIVVRPSVEDCRQADCNDNNSYYLVRLVNRKAEIQEGSQGSELLDMKDHTHLSIHQIKSVLVNDYIG